MHVTSNRAIFFSDFQIFSNIFAFFLYFKYDMFICPNMLHVDYIPIFSGAKIVSWHCLYFYLYITFTYM